MLSWRGWALGAVLIVAGAAVSAETPADGVVRQLQEQGYVDFTVSRTWLGRIQVIALAPDGSRREIVFNPASGEILRDYVDAEDGGSTTPRIMDRPAGGPSNDALPSGGSEDGHAGNQGNNGRSQDQGNGHGQGGGGQGNGQGHGNGQGQGGGQGRLDG